jgi:5-methylcytosine-specific restriction protein B
MNSIEQEFEKMSAYSAQKNIQTISIKDRLARKINQNRHVILFGPPGTGKTRIVSNLLEEKNGLFQLGVVESVQFHPQYSYQDFMEGYSVKEGNFVYKEGVFLKFLKSLNESSSEDVKNIMMIDEINRADISSVFGELLTLLDDAQKKKVTLPVSNDIVQVGKEFSIIGTMNSADKSIALMDFALRRRFDFIFVPPDYNGMSEWINLHQFSFSDFTIDEYVSFAKSINKRIIKNPLLGKNMTLGQALFVPNKQNNEEIDLDDICEMVTDKVIPQIESYLGIGNYSDLSEILSPDIRFSIEHGNEVLFQDVINLIKGIETTE